MKRDSEHGTISTPLLRYGKIGGQFSFFMQQNSEGGFSNGWLGNARYSVCDELETASPDSRLSL